MKSKKTKHKFASKPKKKRRGENLKRYRVSIRSISSAETHETGTNRSQSNEAPSHASETASFQPEVQSPTLSTQSAMNPSNTQQLEPSPATVEKGQQLSSEILEGRRIVDLKFFLGEIQKFDRHKPFDCGFSDMVLKREIRHGLNSKLHFVCELCGLKCAFWTNPKVNMLNVNTAAAAGTISTGGGHAQCQEFLGALNIPSMTSKSFQKHQRRVSVSWIKCAQEEMRKAIELEIKEAIKRGHVDENGIPLLTVVADGSWCKRSYRTNYNALSGVAAIVGFYTRKVLFLAVRNKYCKICDDAARINSPVREHACSKNWNKNSTSMEASIIVEGFLSSESMYNVRFAKLIADGDSSVYKKILDANPYKNLKVEKIECRNHLLRNYARKLKELATTSDGRKNPIHLRRHIGNKILKLRTCVVKAIEYRNKETTSWQTKVQNLKKDIENSPSHCFGEHTKCKELGYFCDGEAKGNEKNLIPEMKETPIYDKLTDIVRSLASFSNSLIYNVDSNSVEQYNAVIAKFVGGKRINFAKSESYKTRCFGAMVQYNTKKAHYYLHKEICKRSPGVHTKIMEDKRLERLKKRKSQPRSRRKLTYCKPDEHYGGNAQRPDLEVNDFEDKKLKFLEELIKSEEEVQHIEKKTVGQNKNQDWFKYRTQLITASNMGRICRKMPQTSCKTIVKSIVYPEDEEFSNKAMIYGNRHEKEALDAVSKEIEEEIEECGLYIDIDQQYFGATPDGRIKNGIVEVKCPPSAAAFPSFEDMFKSKVNKWWVKNIKNETFELKRTHPYFYQVQGQLHVTRSQFCVFGMWTPNWLKIVKIEVDHAFWQKEMEPKLTDFYFQCVLPEIIDPRYPRKMPFRELQNFTLKRKRTTDSN